MFEQRTKNTLLFLLLPHKYRYIEQVRKYAEKSKCFYQKNIHLFNVKLYLIVWQLYCNTLYILCQCLRGLIPASTALKSKAVLRKVHKKPRQSAMQKRGILCFSPLVIDFISTIIFSALRVTIHLLDGVGQTFHIFFAIKNLIFRFGNFNVFDLV